MIILMSIFQLLFFSSLTFEVVSSLKLKFKKWCIFLPDFTTGIVKHHNCITATELRLSSATLSTPGTCPRPAPVEEVIAVEGHGMTLTMCGNQDGPVLDSCSILCDVLGEFFTNQNLIDLLALGIESRSNPPH